MRTLRSGTKKAGAFVAVVAALGLAGGIIGPAGAGPDKGQIKIDGPQLDLATNNEPHARCSAGFDNGSFQLQDIRVMFWKYADDAKVKLRFETMSPTQAAVLDETPDFTVPAGGNPGYTTSLSTELSTWLQDVPKPKQGYYHVRITALSP